MLNQAKVLNSTCNPIMDLVNYEKTIKIIDVEKPVAVQLAKDGKTLLLKHGDVELHGGIDRPLMHQLGGRAWGGNKPFEAIAKIWDKKFFENPVKLEEELATVFRRNDLSVRYETRNCGENKIYGIVTPHFVDVNQLEFRQRFIEQIRKNTTLTLKSCGVEIGKYGTPVEYFELDTPGFQVEFRYGLVYAKNNGYDAYKVDWQRFILVCTNGLMGWRGDNGYKWKHTREIDLGDFVINTVNEGLDNQRFLEKRISLSREIGLGTELLTEFMDRLSLAKASKNRVWSRLEIESQDVGRNEWALSQALTWLGTHKSGIAFGSMPKLTALGTSILENSLERTLHDKVHVDRRGMYGLVLPRTNMTTCNMGVAPR